MIISPILRLTITILPALTFKLPNIFFKVRFLVVYKNPFLEALLKCKGLDRDDIWESILLNDGSVLHGKR